MNPLPTYACIHIRELPAQALLRLSNPAPGPIAILDGKPPLERLCSRNRAAARIGLEAGMSKVEVESFTGIHVLRRDTNAEAKARAVLLNCVAQFTPLAQWVDCDDNTQCSLTVDLAGLHRLFGSPIQIARRIKSEVHTLGMSAQIGISSSFHTAAILARSTPGITLAEPGQEAQRLAELQISLLPMTSLEREILEAWGIERLGQLAALPQKELVSRMGQPGRRLQLLASGNLPHLFQPIEAPFLLEQRQHMDQPVEQMDSLLFLLNTMLEQLITAARDRALAIATLRITAELEGGGLYLRVLRPALPTCDRALLLKLVQLDMTAHPPPAGVLSLEATADAGPTARLQLGLFTPQLPEPGRLQVTLARIAAIVGESRVGWAKLEDTHRDDACTVETFAVKPASSTQHDPIPCTAVRRLRSTIRITPVMQENRPRSFYYLGQPYTVDRTYGPWQRSGTWWSGDMWSVEHWDIVAYSPAKDLLLCILAHDRLRNHWHVEAIYD